MFRDCIRLKLLILEYDLLKPNLFSRASMMESTLSLLLDERTKVILFYFYFIYSSGIVILLLLCIIFHFGLFYFISLCLFNYTLMLWVIMFQVI